MFNLISTSQLHKIQLTKSSFSSQILTDWVGFGAISFAPNNHIVFSPGQTIAMAPGSTETLGTHLLTYIAGR